MNKFAQVIKAYAGSNRVVNAPVVVEKEVIKEVIVSQNVNVPLTLNKIATMTFESPQTGSPYSVLADFGAIKLCARDLDRNSEQPGRNRVRIQVKKGNVTQFETIKSYLACDDVWSGLGGATGGADHFSTVVSDADLLSAVADAAQAVVRYAVENNCIPTQFATARTAQA